MLVVDETRLNLLKMKEKLLKISRDRKIAEEYKDLVLSVDKDEYDALIAKIKSINYMLLPLEEQVSYLNEIRDDYNALNQLQCRYRDVYKEYADGDLELSDISVIAIDDIKDRSSFIQGYMMNQKNLESNKQELERLNLDLIEAMKKQDITKSRVMAAGRVIKDSVLGAEGRVISLSGRLEYTSIKKEYEAVDLDLERLLMDQDYYEEEFKTAKKIKKDNEETLEAADICYDENNTNQDIYDKIKDDNKKSEYKLILLEIIGQICSPTDDYDLMVNKLNRVLNLIDERKLYLRDKFYIDPFDRLRIQEQLKMLDNVSNEREEIDNIKKTIAYFSNIIEDMEERDREYARWLNMPLQILATEEVMEPVDLTQFETFEDKAKETFEDNRVINIRDANEKLDLNIVHERTDGVINRVNELFNNKKEEIVNPELFIEIPKEEKTNDDTLFMDLTTNNVTPEEEPSLVVPEETNTEPIFETLPEPNLVLENETIPSAAEEPVFETLSEPVLETVPAEVKEPAKEETVDDTIFQEVSPFEETPLFADRYDDGMFEEIKPKDVFNPQENKVEPVVAPAVTLPPVVEQEEVAMPDAFWMSKDEAANVDDYETPSLSFDEQISRLINSDNAEVKAKTR